jgi:hypothetical protein
VCHPSFGESIAFDEALDLLIEKVPRLVSTDAQLLLRDRYETSYGIFNHEVKGKEAGEHPFALILHNWNEDVITNGPLHERIEQYLEYQILKHFGLSVNEFLDNPTFMCDLYIKIASERNRKENTMTENALNQFKAEPTK